MLNSTIHAPHRLLICALLSRSLDLEFKVLKEHLDVSDSVLSKQIKQLEEAGYLKVTKKTEQGRQRTWLSLTKEGRKAYNAHVEALKKIVDPTP